MTSVLTSYTGEQKGFPATDLMAEKKPKKAKPKKVNLFSFQDEFDAKKAEKAQAPKAAINEAKTSSAALDRFEPAVVVSRRAPDANYFKRIDPRKKAPQYVLMKDVFQNILFSQNTVSDFNISPDDGQMYPISVLANKLFHQFKEEGALDIVRMGEGKYISVDNRRLLIAKKIATIDKTYGIWVRVHDSEKALTENQSNRFQLPFENKPTWGNAVHLRMGRSSNEGYTKPVIMSEGEPASSQTVSIYLHGCDLSKLNPDVVKLIQQKAPEGVLEI